MKRRLRLLLLLVATALLLPWAGLVVAACWLSLPSALSDPERRRAVLVLDRDGVLLREVQVGSSAVDNHVELSELSRWVVPALIAAEDSRFYEHPGVDPVAVARALGQLAVERRIVSGASTLTQQLARNLEARPRTVAGKLREAALALRIEASLSKAQILEQYLSRIEFGPQLVGIEAASRHYFGKSARALDLSEAAALVSLPRGPSLYDPRRRPQLLERRRLRVLSRMQSLGLLSRDELARAELTPMRLVEHSAPRGAEHLSFALARRFAADRSESARARTVRTTLSSTLQREAEELAKASLPALAAHSGGAISLVVVDNQTGDVLAYVGSPGYFDSERLGANDGVTALRQPGSALKPFVYAAAIAELGYGAATLLPDLPRDYVVPGGSFAPRNYDQRFRGPVLLRQALGSSLNMPALAVASRLGPAKLLQALHDFGFASLDRAAEHYGVGLALGDGEVTLLEVTTAYAALARGGELLPARLVLDDASGTQTFARRVLPREVAALVTDMLSDDSARASGFGRDSVLNLPFAVAAKTGTSKGFRDNWAIGYTREVTVGVWVGNFDGTPLSDASGITVAGPVFHDVMQAAMRGRSPAPLFDDALLAHAEVCALSGKLPGEACRQRRRERFVHGHTPSERCELHVLAHVDAQGREQAARCGGEERVLERYASEYAAWAQQAGRPLAGLNPSPTCPPEANRSAGAHLTSPRPEQSFAIVPDGPTRQEILLSATSSAPTLRFIVDGRPSEALRPPFRLPWQLTPGTHRVQIEGEPDELVTFHVKAVD